MPKQKPSKQNTNSTNWQPGVPWEPGSLGFSEPVDTNNGYFVTEATLKQNQHALQIFIRCRDRRVLDTYVPVLNVNYSIVPEDGSQQHKKTDHAPTNKETDKPSAKKRSGSALEQPDLHIYITLTETNVAQGTLTLNIDPPLDGNKKHKYHLPKADSAHVTVMAVSGEIHTEFSLASTPVDLVHGHDNTFNAPGGSDSSVKLLLVGKQGSNAYQITGAFSRVAQEAAKKGDGLFEGEEDA